MKEKTLKEMNNVLKVDINEASAISKKCKRRLIVLAEQYFKVDLPNEDYLNIDLKLLENGNLIMREIEYETKEKVTNKEELQERFELFQEAVDSLLYKKATNFETMREKSDKSNLIIVIILTISFIVIGLYAIHELILKDFSGLIFLAIILMSFATPIRNRYIMAWKSIKSIYKKRKK